MPLKPTPFLYGQIRRSRGRDRIRWPLPTALLAALLFTACRARPAAAPEPPKSSPQTEIHIVLAAGANDDSPVAIALLLVSTKEAFEALLRMDASDWFASRAQFHRDNPGSVDERAWEFVPGQEIAPLRLPVRDGRKYGVVFVRFHEPGAHRYPFTPRGALDLRIGGETVEFTQRQEGP